MLGPLLAALPLRVDMEEAECVCSALCHLLLDPSRMESAPEMIQPLVKVGKQPHMRALGRNLYHKPQLEPSGKGRNDPNHQAGWKYTVA